MDRREIFTRSPRSEERPSNSAEVVGRPVAQGNARVFGHTVTEEVLEKELKALIVDALALADVVPEKIGSEDPLFGEGLGLDSVDALELAMAVSEKYGVEISDDTEEAREVFASVRALAAHIRSHLAGATAS